jgi:hypothetical protein
VFDGERRSSGAFGDLAALRGSEFFTHSQAQYPPGYEASSPAGDPGFRRIGPDGRFRESDDVRPHDDGAGVGGGVALPEDLARLDPVSSNGRPDVGCYPRGAQALHVGVDDRRSFPSADS